MTVEASKIAVPIPPALRKKDSKLGKVYTRPRKIHEELKLLLALPRAEILQRCEIEEKTSPLYVASECLVHLLRACRTEPPNSYFEGIYKALHSRIVRRLRSGVSSDGESVALSALTVRDKVVDRFNELLMRDRSGYADKLDFYEVRFDRTLKLLTITTQRQVWKETNRQAPLQDPESGEIFAEVDEAAGAVDPFENEDSDEKDYRLRLEAAIDNLPAPQKRIVTMLKLGIPIDSIHPEAVTISKTMNRSEKTIRTMRNKAFAAIKAFIEKGDTL